MEYVDEHGRPAYGVVWSPGPMPGTVWVLPESGASKTSASVVKVASREQVPEPAVRRYLDRNLSDYLGRFKYAPRLPAKAWHEALGYDPREVVREDALALDVDVETASEPAAEPVSEPVPASAPPDAPAAPETVVEPVAVPVAVKASDPRGKPAGDTYKGVHTEEYIGHTIRIRRGKEWGTFSTSINGHPLGNTYGTTNALAVRELKLARGYIDDAIARPGNYHNGFGEYVWAKSGQTTMPREAWRAEVDVETPAETPAEPVASAVPPDDPATAQASPEPVAVPMATAALPGVQPSPHDVPAPHPLSIMSSREHGQHRCIVDHVQRWTWSTTMTITDHDHVCHVPRGRHDSTRGQARAGPESIMDSPARARAPAPRADALPAPDPRPRRAPLPAVPDADAPAPASASASGPFDSDLPESPAA